MNLQHILEFENESYAIHVPQQKEKSDKRIKLKVKLLICCLFCFNCAPLVSKLSFFPKNTPRVAHQFLPPNVKEQIIVTEDNKKLQCFIVKNPVSKNLLIYFHGNAGNIYQRIPELLKISKANVDVLGVGYRGFGKSTGYPSEQGIYRDGIAAFRYAIDSLNYKQNNVFILGRSIGTTVAVDLSVEKDLAGVILVTPLTNAKEYAKAHGLGILSVLAGSAFNNLKKCPNIISPVLVIHGTKDEVIPFEMGKTIFKDIRSEKTFVKIEGGFHNNLEYRGSALYWGSINEFIAKYGK